MGPGHECVEVPESWREARRLLRFAAALERRACVSAAGQMPREAAAWLSFARRAALHAAEELEAAAEALLDAGRVDSTEETSR